MNVSPYLIAVTIIAAIMLIIAIVDFVIAIKTSGTLRIDHNNPDKDVYRIEIDDLEKLSKKRRIILNVDNDADLTQK